MDGLRPTEATAIFLMPDVVRHLDFVSSNALADEEDSAFTAFSTSHFSWAFLHYRVNFWARSPTSSSARDSFPWRVRMAFSFP